VDVQGTRGVDENLGKNTRNEPKALCKFEKKESGVIRAPQLICGGKLKWQGRTLNQKKVKKKTKQGGGHRAGGGFGWVAMIPEGDSNKKTKKNEGRRTAQEREKNGASFGKDQHSENQGPRE